MRTRRALLTVASIAVVVVGTARPVAACGGLVAPNGAVHLVRTSTLAAWHRGVEHYVTSFQFAGGGAEFGSIVPLPAVPTSVERGGDWTLQRLERETSVAAPAAGAAAGTASGALAAQVILETKIDALDITVLKGGGREVGEWAQQHGFLLTPDAPEILDYYSRRSPVFLAARFDTQAAADRGQQVGDGTPVHITMPLRHPWVPLRILTLGRGGADPIDADVFLLTDWQPVTSLPPGATVVRSGAASRELLADLRSDKGMGWLPTARMWLTFVRVAGPPAALQRDITTRWPAPPPRPTTTVPPTTTTMAPPATTTAPTAPPSTLADIALARTSDNRSAVVALTVPAALLLMAVAGTLWPRLRRRWR